MHRCPKIHLMTVVQPQASAVFISFSLFSTKVEAYVPIKLLL